jgi:hypothetical protein
LVTVARVRQQLVEEGVDGVLTPKRSRIPPDGGSSTAPAKLSTPERRCIGEPE